MSELGAFLKQLRTTAQRSSRWVERRSKALFPQQPARQISHTYLRQIEEGRRPSPSPTKLEVLARIYEVDYGALMRLAGHVPDDDRGTVRASSAAADMEAAARLVQALETHGVNAAYFMNNVARLRADSLSLVTRLVSSLVIQEGGQQDAAPASTRERESEG